MNKGAVGVTLIYVGVMVVAVVVIRSIERKAVGPDFGRTMYMRGCNGLKRIAYGQAEWWGRLGMKAEMYYNKGR